MHARSTRLAVDTSQRSAVIQVSRRRHVQSTIPNMIARGMVRIVVLAVIVSGGLVRLRFTATILSICTPIISR